MASQDKASYAGAPSGQSVQKIKLDCIELDNYKSYKTCFECWNYIYPNQQTFAQYFFQLYEKEEATKCFIRIDKEELFWLATTLEKMRENETCGQAFGKRALEVERKSWLYQITQSLPKRFGLGKYTRFIKLNRLALIKFYTFFNEKQILDQTF